MVGISSDNILKIDILYVKSVNIKGRYNTEGYNNNQMENSETYGEDKEYGNQALWWSSLYCVGNGFAVVMIINFKGDQQKRNMN